MLPSTSDIDLEAQSSSSTKKSRSGISNLFRQLDRGLSGRRLISNFAKESLVDRRYKRYCDQMLAVVSSFEAMAGQGSATVYSALASKAMSRHFRCLRDGIVSQIQTTKKAMGEKDPVASETTKGETPRLKLLDQCIRQQKSFQHGGGMESHPWRPQRGLPERSGISEQSKAPPVARVPTSGQTTNPPIQAPQLAQPAVVPSSGLNANPLDLFPQGLPSMGTNAGAGNLDFLRNSPQFRALQAMVQSNPHILQPILQELGKQNPQIMRLIQEHQGEFLHLINEPAEGEEGNLLCQLAATMPQAQALTVTPEEHEAIEWANAADSFNNRPALEVVPYFEQTVVYDRSSAYHDMLVCYNKTIDACWS